MFTNPDALLATYASIGVVDTGMFMPQKFHFAENLLRTVFDTLPTGLTFMWVKGDFVSMEHRSFHCTMFHAISVPSELVFI